MLSKTQECRYIVFLSKIKFFPLFLWVQWLFLRCFPGKRLANTAPDVLQTGEERIRGFRERALFEQDAQHPDGDARLVADVREQ